MDVSQADNETSCTIAVPRATTPHKRGRITRFVYQASLLLCQLHHANTFAMEVEIMTNTELGSPAVSPLVTRTTGDPERQ